MSDETGIAYSIVIPEVFDPAKEFPVLLALPPGEQTTGRRRRIDRVWKPERRSAA